MTSTPNWITTQHQRLDTWACRSQPGSNTIWRPVRAAAVAGAQVGVWMASWADCVVGTGAPGPTQRGAGLLTPLAENLTQGVMGGAGAAAQLTATVLAAPVALVSPARGSTATQTLDAASAWAKTWGARVGFALCAGLLGAAIGLLRGATLLLKAVLAGALGAACGALAIPYAPLAAGWAALCRKPAAMTQPEAIPWRDNPVYEPSAATTPEATTPTFHLWNNPLYAFEPGVVLSSPPEGVALPL